MLISCDFFRIETIEAIHPAKKHFTIFGMVPGSAVKLVPLQAVINIIVDKLSCFRIKFWYTPVRSEP